MAIDTLAEGNTAIRLAQPDEADAIRALVRAAYADYAAQVGRTPSPVKDDYERRIAGSDVWVLRLGDGIIGVVVLKERGDGLVIDNVAVSPSEQGHGYGQMLIAFAAEEARRRGLAKLRLYANVIMTRNIAIYEHLGFVEVERFRDGDATRVQMAKPVG